MWLSLQRLSLIHIFEKEKVQKSLRILSKFTDNKQINIIFYLLAVEELCVCDIACLLNLSMASASHHLRKLANQNILDTRREGKIIYYFIKDDDCLLYTSKLVKHHNLVNVKTYLNLLKAFRIKNTGCFFCSPQIFVTR